MGRAKPNIVFIIADDHRSDAINTSGNHQIFTPNLDHLAEMGTSFQDTHIMGGFTGAVCAPSRASVHTGANVFRSGGIFAINPALALMPETLKAHGYDTYAVGKWHNDMESFNRSFHGGANIFFGGMSDHYQVPVYDFDPSGVYPEEKKSIGEKHSTELFTDAAVDFLHGYERDEPFFLYMALTSPHDPRTAPAAYHDLYDPDKITLPPNFMAAHPFDNGELAVRDEMLAEWPRQHDEVRRHIADYYAMISHLDAQIGRVIQALKTSGQLEDTIIVYTADHGLAVGQHGLMGKQNMYEHSIRIPWIMCGPGLPAGKAVEGLNMQTDIFPTIFNLINLPVPDTVEGANLLPVISGKTASPRNTVYAVYRDIQRMVKDERWKLIRYYHAQDRDVGEHRMQLFDLQEDPWETMDLAGDPAYAHVAAFLANELAAWQSHVNDPLAEIPVIPADA